MPDGAQRKERNNSVKGKTHMMTAKSGGKIEVTQKSVNDAKSGTGAFSKPSDYKGQVIKNKAGKMSGYKTHDGKYTRTTDPVSRKKGEKAMEYDKKLHSKKSSDKSARNERFKGAKPKGT